MPVTLVAEEVEEMIAAPLAPRSAPPAPDTAAVAAQVLKIMNNLGAVLAVRLMLLLAVIGAFALAYFTIQHPVQGTLWVLGIYNVSIVLPLVWLAQRRG